MAGNNKRQLGSQKEQMAAEYLIEKGWKILDRNFYCRQGEIDLIAISPEQILVFLEVKYRKDKKNGLPEEAVNKKKQEKIQKAARIYLYQKGISMNRKCRFDVVAIIGDRLKLIENAFGYW